MIEYISEGYPKIYDINSNISNQKKDQSYNSDIGSIYDNSLHYFCTKCLKFPFIKFCKDRKSIRLTCSCFNNKKVLIEDLFLFENKYSLLIKKNIFSTLISNKNKNKVIKDILLCKKHNKKFSGFSIIYLNNICQDCFNKKDSNDIIINFYDIKMNNEEIFKKLEDYSVYTNDNCENNIETIKIIKINETIFEKLSEEEEIIFKKLIIIIINDYKNYPNFSHFFNIKNLLHFFNIDDKPIIEKEKEEEKGDYKLIKNNEQIIIEYINNNPHKTKLFSKIFVKNNKKNFKIEIECEILDLIDEYKFKKKDKKVRIKLFINNEVSEINMYKMFANCINLICVDGISKLNKIKKKNIDKLFYNCISLLFIPDLNEFEIQK